MEIENILKNNSPLSDSKRWLKEAKEKYSLTNYNAACLSTLNSQNQINSRVILIKKIDDQGFFFYTNYSSEKANEIEFSKNVSLNLFWDDLGRQLRIKGTAKKTSREDSVQYWNQRPKASQISQYISKQSTELKSREHLEKLYQQAEQEFSNQGPNCPENWGGYIVEPSSIEFWVASPIRLHDRVRFVNTSGKWQVQRLFP